jgi:hypothetical protein
MVIGKKVTRKEVTGMKKRHQKEKVYSIKEGTKKKLESDGTVRCDVVSSFPFLW